MQETIAAPVTGVWSPPEEEKPLIVLYLTSLPCSRLLVFILLSLSASVSGVMCSVSCIQDDLTGDLPSTVKLPNRATLSVQTASQSPWVWCMSDALPGHRVSPDKRVSRPRLSKKKLCNQQASLVSWGCQ